MAKKKSKKQKKAPARERDLSEAVRAGALARVRRLCTREMVRHPLDGPGCAALYLAAQRGDPPVILCLVQEFGADVNQPERDGATPVFVAAQLGREAVVW
jgi:hypothetical protein